MIRSFSSRKSWIHLIVTDLHEKSLNYIFILSSQDPPLVDSTVECANLILLFPLYSDIFALVATFVVALDKYTEEGEFHRTYSQLAEVPTDIPEAAIEVYLYGNQINQLRGGSFSNLQNCTKVDVGTNHIVTIETGAFEGLNNVEKVNLYLNSLREIRGSMWKGLSSLRILILSNNNLHSLAPGSFLSLVKLSLWSNDIEEIKGHMLEGLVSLKTLLLGENKLSSLTSGTFVNIPNLQILRLRVRFFNAKSMCTEVKYYGVPVNLSTFVDVLCQ